MSKAAREAWHRENRAHTKKLLEGLAANLGRNRGERQRNKGFFKSHDNFKSKDWWMLGVNLRVDQTRGQVVVAQPSDDQQQQLSKAA